MDFRQFKNSGGDIQAAMNGGEVITGLNGRDPDNPSEQAVETEALIDSGRSLTEFASLPIDHSKTLLGANRWLCRGARAGLVISSTGAGKSTTVTQAAIFWSLGETAFGIEPSGPLRILIIQAENDDGDNSEAAEGIMRHFEINAAQRAQIAQRTLSIALRGKTGLDFLITLRALCKCWKPDLVIIDPLGVYLGDDPKDAGKAGAFLDGPLGINKLTADLNIGALIVCHTPKTNHRDTTGWNSSQWSYASAGAAVINDSTGCSLIIDQADNDGKLFKFIAGKRGGRIGWEERERYYCHGSDGIYWREATPEDMAVSEVDVSIETHMNHVLEFIDETHPMKKANLITYARKASEHLRRGLAKGAARQAIDLCIAEGKLYEWTERREKLVSFSPPPTQEDSHGG